MVQRSVSGLVGTTANVVGNWGRHDEAGPGVLMAKPKTIVGQSLKLRARIEFLEETLKEAKGLTRKLKKQSREEVASIRATAAYGYANIVDETYKGTLDRLKALMTNWTKELTGAKKKLKALERTLQGTKG